MSVREIAPEYLEDYVLPIRRDTPTNDLSPERIARRIACQYGVTYEDMMSHQRWGNLSEARLALYLELRALRWSYPQIGRFVGGRDHTTIMAAVHKSEGRPR